MYFQIISALLLLCECWIISQIQPFLMLMDEMHHLSSLSGQRTLLSITVWFKARECVFRDLNDLHLQKKL